MIEQERKDCLCIGWLGLCLLVVLVTWFHLSSVQQITWPVFFGDKTLAIFDLWALQHFMSGIILAGGLSFVSEYRKSKPLRTSTFICLILLVAFTWELSELWMETGGLGGEVSYWKAGLEHWANRLIADPVMVLLGALLCRAEKRFFWFGVFGSWLWAPINFLSPNCMHIQEEFIQLFK